MDADATTVAQAGAATFVEVVVDHSVFEVFLGIDVGKDKLDVAVKLKETDSAAGPAKRAHEAWVAKNTDQGAAEIVKRLQAIKPALIALEATGAYEQRVFRALREAGLPAVIVKPGSVKNFIRSMGRQAKTDKIDGGRCRGSLGRRRPGR